MLFFFFFSWQLKFIFSLVIKDSYFLYTLLNFSRFSKMSICYFYEQKKNYSWYLKIFSFIKKIFIEVCYSFEVL